jgi:4-hydroxybenzoate polyprenyltransferase
MNTLKKIFLGNNLGLTIVMVLAIVLFIWATGGHIINGAIITFAAIMVVACAYILYKEYKSSPKPSSTPAPKKTAKKPVKKTTKKK